MKLGEKTKQERFWICVGRMTDKGKEYDLLVSSEDETGEDEIGEDEIGEYEWDEAYKKFKDSLPTAKELHLIAANIDLVPNVKNDEWYWSSTECYRNYAWVQRLSDGYQGNAIKCCVNLVRLVRRVYI